jgi:hypothetical protein
MNLIRRTIFCVGLIITISTAAPFEAVCLRKFSGITIQSQGNPNTKVWVNTNSSVYHCPGTHWYGNTKEGKYMTQKEAQAKGYRPAYGIACG